MYVESTVAPVAPAANPPGCPGAYDMDLLGLEDDELELMEAQFKLKLEIIRRKKEAIRKMAEQGHKRRAEAEPTVVTVDDEAEDAAAREEDAAAARADQIAADERLAKAMEAEGATTTPVLTHVHGGGVCPPDTIFSGPITGGHYTIGDNAIGSNVVVDAVDGNHTVKFDGLTVRLDSCVILTSGTTIRADGMTLTYGMDGGRYDRILRESTVEEREMYRVVQSRARDIVKAGSKAAEEARQVGEEARRAGKEARRAGEEARRAGEEIRRQGEQLRTEATRRWEEARCRGVEFRHHQHAQGEDCTGCATAYKARRDAHVARCAADRAKRDADKKSACAKPKGDKKHKRHGDSYTVIGEAEVVAMGPGATGVKNTYTWK